MNDAGISGGTDSKLGPGSWISGHRRAVIVFAMVVFFSFPVIYLIVKSSPSPPIVNQSTPASKGLDVAEMEAMSIQQPSPDNFINLSLAYYQVQRYQDCIGAARKSLALKPDYAVAYNNISAAFVGMSLWDSAIFYATEALHFEPDLQLARYNLKVSLDQKKALNESIKQLEDSVRTEPTPDRLISLSLAYHNAGRYQECIAAAKEALKLKPDFPEAWNNICSASNMLGRFQDGKAAGEEALRLRPDYELAGNNLNWSLRELGKK
jgi:tetratricopeptide (TPR) repeat protein